MPSTTSNKANASDYTLKLLEDDKQIQFTRLQNSNSWKGRLSHENYMLRETTLSKCKITNSSQNYLLVFALYQNNQPQTFVASCEILIRQSWKFDYDVNLNQVIKKEIKSGCIGGVYTYPEYRGKGLATIMIDKLVDKNLTGNDGFLFLYSEVGEYYARNGFKSFEVPLTNIPLMIESKKFDPKLPYKVELIKYHEFESLFEYYNKYELNHLHEKTMRDHKSRIMINPTADYIDWFHLRSMYLSHVLFHQSQPSIDYQLVSYDSIIKTYQDLEPSIFGIKLIDPQTNQLIGFIVWTYEWVFNDDTNTEEDYVTIIKTFVDEDHYDYTKYAMMLIELCKQYLQQDDLFKKSPIKTNNLLKMVLWESDINQEVLNQLNQKFNIKLGLANGSRSAIMTNDKDHTDLINGDLIWELNNKIPWF